MSLPADVLQRIVLFMNPRVGQSVDRVYELSVALQRDQRRGGAPPGLDPARRRTGRRAAKTADTRSIYGAAETARRALSDVTADHHAKRPEVVLRRAAGAGDD